MHRTWPESSQQELLRAVFASGSAGASAFEAWRCQIDMADHPDVGSFRLLPALSRRLVADRRDDPLVSKLQGIARRNWFQNQRYFRSWAPVLESLYELGTPCMLIGGPSLALRLNDYALLTETILTILVRSNQACQAIERLQAIGWRSKKRLPPLTESYVTTSRMLGFRDEVGREIRLHWHLLSASRSTGSDWWDHAVPVCVHNVPVWVLDSADQVLYSCAEDSLTPNRSTFQRAVDVVLVIHGEAEIDWNRIIWQAKKRSVILPLLAVMRYIQSVLDDSIPAPIWEQLQSLG